MVAAVLLSAGGLPATGLAAPAFVADAPLSTDTGHVHVGWTSNEPVTLTLTDPDGQTRPVYNGSGDGIFLSGLADGEYALELVGESGAKAAPLALLVTHQSLSQALWLAGLGGLVFLLTVIVILRGTRGEGADG